MASVSTELELDPNTVEQVAAARRTVARHATNPADLAQLLDMLGIGPTPPAPPPVLTPVPEPAPPKPRRSKAPGPGADYPCVRCTRQMWHLSWPPEARKDRVGAASRGLCHTCYSLPHRQARGGR